MTTMTPPMADMVERLLPCPFCGSEPKHQERHNPMSRWRHSIDCCSSSCGMSGPVAASKREAADLWNDRARLSQAGAGGGVDDGLSAAEKFDLAQSLATELGYGLSALAPSPSAVGIETLARYLCQRSGKNPDEVVDPLFPDMQPQLLWTAWTDDAEAISAMFNATPPPTPVQPTASVEAVRKSLAEVLAFARALEKHSGKGTAGRRGGAIFARAEAALASLTPAPTPSLKLDISKEWLERKARQEGDIDPTTGAPKVCPECDGKGEVLGKHTFGKGWEMVACPRCLGNGSTKHAELMAMLDATPSSPVSAPSPAGGVREGLEAAAKIADEQEQICAEEEASAGNRNQELAWGMCRNTAGEIAANIRALSSPATPEPVSAPANGEVVRRVRHKKRGTTYQVLGEAGAQVSTGAYRVWPSDADKHEGDGHPARMAHDGLSLTVYRCEQTGKLWCRFPDEFEDGRFEDLPALSNPAPGHGEGVPVAARRVRHKKRGTLYEVLGQAQVQTGHPLEDYEVVTVYRSLSTGDMDDPRSPMKGEIWIRPKAEFEDGRFEDVAHRATGDKEVG